MTDAKRLVWIFLDKKISLDRLLSNCCCFKFCFSMYIGQIYGVLISDCEPLLCFAALFELNNTGVFLHKSQDIA